MQKRLFYQAVGASRPYTAQEITVRPCQRLPADSESNAWAKKSGMVACEWYLYALVYIYIYIYMYVYLYMHICLHIKIQCEIQWGIYLGTYSTDNGFNQQTLYVDVLHPSIYGNLKGKMMIFS